MKGFIDFIRERGVVGFYMKKNLVILIIIAVLATIMYFVSGRFQIQNQPIPCTLEAKICPNGSAVGRSGPNCEFAPCPTVDLPRIPEKLPSNKCPQVDYIDCMPGTDRKLECNPTYLQWAQENCPGFKGAAY